MRLGSVRLVFTVSTVLCEMWGRPSPRVHRDVETSQGVARGYLTPDPPHFAYFGIPYAWAPTRRDRFKAPKPPPEWDGTFEAIHKIKCVQPKADGEENCLVVNVFTPKHAILLPVLVFVHDGDFQNGWGAYEPPKRILDVGFVIVTFNYRLGALGFLCLGIADAGGNAGLKDQIAALYWVHVNIQNFGGNPRDVTVYGTGAGAASVQLILLSGMVNGLLHRVVLESGSLLSPSSMTYEPLSTAYEGAASIGYNGTDDPDELYKFYQDSPADDLANIFDFFLPCVDNMTDFVYNLIDSDPIEKLNKGDFYKVPMLITFTEKDTMSIIGKGTKRFKYPPNEFEYLLPNNLQFDSPTVRKRLGKIVKEFYFADSVVKGNAIQCYGNYIHDILTEYPMVKMAKLFAVNNTNSVYVMKFTLPKSEISEESTPSSDTLLDYLYKDEEKTDKVILEQLVIMLTRFMKLGDPTPLTATLIPLIWQPVPNSEEVTRNQITNVPILLFDRHMKMGVSGSNQRLLFWNKVYNKFLRQHLVEQEQEETED